jgi:ABC-2 type transport system permease protein
MYALQDYIGEDRVSLALRNLLQDYKFKGPPYPTALGLVNYLRRVTPPQFQYLYADWFENITIFDNRAIAATYSQLPDAKYQVRLRVEAKKYRSDGKGQEQRVAVHDLIEVGVQDADGNFLYLRKHNIAQERSDISILVDKPPARAGIDPLIKLIDRNPDDNTITVEKK